jgi:hypothetical protein
MPRGDGTGPAGQGAMTGRRAGYCAGYDMPGFANAAPGYGYGRGYGGGWARGGRHRNWFYATGLPRDVQSPWPWTQLCTIFALPVARHGLKQCPCPQRQPEMVRPRSQDQCDLGRAAATRAARALGFSWL